MTEVDTSSYPKAAALPVQKSALEIAGQLGSLQQQKLQIDQAKLDQANQGLTYLTRAMTSLGPNATKDQYKEIGAQMVQSGLVPENMLHIWNDRVDAAPDSPTFFKQTLAATADHQMQLKLGTGTDTNQSDNSNVYQGKTDAMTGGFTPATQAPLQIPPTQPNVNNQRILPNGQPNPNYLQPGIVGSSGPPGIVASPRGLPVQAPSAAPAASMPIARPRLPVQAPPAVSGPTGPTVQTGYNFNQRFAGEPVVTGAPPGVGAAIAKVGEQSGTDYAAALTRAKNFKTELYPAERALEGVKELGTQGVGPGTDALNNIKSAIVTWLPNVDQKTIDGVSTFEQTRKYLTQIARSSGNTGTNDQLAAAFEGNPSTKLSNAATENVLKSVIALRKMEQAQTLMFAKTGLPESEYSKWVAGSQNQFDPRAFGFDMMTPEAKKKLVTQLGKNPTAYKKFEDTLHFANDADLIAPPPGKQ